MGYRDYNAPGINVNIEYAQETVVTQLTDFFNVYIGKGITSKERVSKLDSIKANMLNYPEVVLDYPLSGNVNSQVFGDTDFVVQNMQLNRPVMDTTGETPVKVSDTTPLVEGTDYEIVTEAELRATAGNIRTTIKILNTAKVTAADTVFTFDLRMTNTADDYKLRIISPNERYYIKDILGPEEIVEDGVTLLNDLAIAAEIHFRTNGGTFYYLEVPRVYGDEPTTAEFLSILGEVYYYTNAYRMVPLTYDEAVLRKVNEFTTTMSNPIDRREVIAFGSINPIEVTDKNDIEAHVEVVGNFAASFNNKRFALPYGPSEIELAIGTKRYSLPLFYLSVAIAALDSAVGMSDPISLREINVFSRVKIPRLRPAEWNKIARNGVMIVFQEDANGPLVIQHQLSTAQTDVAEEQELSITKNFDAATKLLRDRLKPYAGSYNITPSYQEKLDAATTLAINECKEKGFVEDIQVISGWQTRTITDGANGTVTNKRNLVTRLSMKPAYPANNLDILISI